MKFDFHILLFSYTKGQLVCKFDSLHPSQHFFSYVRMEKISSARML